VLILLTLTFSIPLVVEESKIPFIKYEYVPIFDFRKKTEAYNYKLDAVE